MTNFYNDHYQLIVPNLIENPINTLSDTIFLLTGKFLNAKESGFFL